MDLRSDFRIVSLCSGSGAGDIALRLAIPGARTICFVENEAHACASLVGKMETRALAPALVWDDVRTFDGGALRGLFHCLVATYPCQPFSVAGKGLAEKDPRHLWPEIARIIDASAPSLVFLENVRGHLRRGFERVCGDLREMGYETRAGLFSSEAVGAPHGRQRLFALAYSRRSGLNGRASEPHGLNGGRASDHDCGTGGTVEYAGRVEYERPAMFGRQALLGAEHACGAMADSGNGFFPLAVGGSGERNGARSGGAQLAASAIEGLPGTPYAFPPYRTGDYERWADVLVSYPWLRPSLAQAETQCLLRRVAHGLAGELEFGRERVDRLRAVGNGITPVAMAFAFVTLATAHGLAEEFGFTGDSVLEVVV